MKRTGLLFLMFLFFIPGFAHPWKPQHYVIIDTDCGLDDFRAISMLLASTDVRILAITTSDGVLDAESGFRKVQSLLGDLHHDGILVGLNSDPKIKVEDCISAKTMEWGTPVTIDYNLPDAIDVVNFVLHNTQGPITFISLGSLNTVSKCEQKCKDFSLRISNIIWSSNPDFKISNFNFDIDKNSALKVVDGKIPLKLISGGNFRNYNDSLIRFISELHTPCSDKMISSFASRETYFSRALFDESVVIYLHHPEFFQSDTLSNLIRYTLKASQTDEPMQSAYGRILTGETINQNQVFSEFPMDTANYINDIQTVFYSTLAKFGKEEWVDNVLANELHRHVGVYAVIGVKMGVRAKEYFGAGIDEMNIVSYAGLVTPYSCLNDGLQVSTGATLGHGLISIAPDTTKLPQADFTYMNQTIRLTLKKEYQSKIGSEIRELNKIYGLDSNIYWDMVRILAIKYWSTLDRHNIFDIQLR
jgi:inosine-uridine nucleoside N-ribohydrolase/formylmethanofuran dehydrogenase subunit E